MTQNSILIGKAELTAFVSAIFVATGLAKDHADAWAKMLVWANLRGTAKAIGLDDTAATRVPG